MSLNFLQALLESEKTENERSEKEARKRSKSKKEEPVINEDRIYIPPGWKDNGLSFVETIVQAKSISKSKKADLSEEQRIILSNLNLLKSCYCTPKNILRLAKAFIGKFNFEAFDNPHSYVKDEEFAHKGMIVLDGSSEDKDGYRISNWPRLPGISTFVNPQFSRLNDGSGCCNIYAGLSEKPSIAFICTFDYNKWFKECLEIADYLLILGRVNFIPMEGVKTSSPSWNNAMFIYNSKIDVKSQFVNCDGTKYYCVNLKECRKNKALDQIQLLEDEIIK